MRIVAGLACALLSWTMATSAESPAALSNEMHAAYCIPVLQSDLAYIQRVVQAVEDSLRHIEEVPADVRPQALTLLKHNQRELPQQAAARQAALDRMRSFLQPRKSHLDEAALDAATKSGEADVQEMAGQANRCAAQCVQADGEQNAACMSKCAGTELGARLAACRNPSWLPR